MFGVLVPSSTAQSGKEKPASLRPIVRNVENSRAGNRRVWQACISILSGSAITALFALDERRSVTGHFSLYDSQDD
jgi:hypothetical protein